MITTRIEPGSFARKPELLLGKLSTSGVFCMLIIFSDLAEVQAIATMIEKQAQIVVKQKEVSEDGCPLLLVPALFRNPNVEEVLTRQKQKRDQAREDAQKKKETDKMQREKDKLAKQDRKEKEKKRTQKGERKR
uniref:Coiled-coil domain containing 43 n=1 Tax=Nothobranchius furzeri TaxID=105023 RepID=A0A8C6KIC2_NOTFU